MTTDPLLLAAAFAAAVVAGAGNAVAGGGTNLSFPVLVWLGLPPVAANATNSVGLWPGSAAAAWSYRGRMGGVAPVWWWLVVPSMLGGALGAWLLLTLPAGWFERIAPFLVIAASALVAVEPAVRDRLLRRFAAGAGDAGRGPGWLATAATVQFAIAVYGGYFGAGIGILTLSSLGLLGMTDLQRANGFKNLLATTMKGVAVAWFVLEGVLVWPVALAMAVGATLGGWVAGVLVQRVSAGVLRALVVSLGVAMGLVMLLNR